VQNGRELARDGDLGLAEAVSLGELGRSLAIELVSGFPG
jgi:hypothetical protein